MNPQYGFVLGNQASRRIDKHGWHTNLKYVVCPSSPSGCIGIGIGCVGIGIGCIGLTAALLLLKRTLFILKVVFLLIEQMLSHWDGHIYRYF